MIRSRHKQAYVWFFNWYSRVRIRKHFRKVIISGDVPQSDASVLLLGNHFSWWDGFFVLYINQKIFRRKVHVMMLEEQLQTRMFLNKAGAFSIKKGSRSIIESLDYCKEILESGENLLSIFPQGAIQSVYVSDIRFEKGIERLIEKIDRAVQLVFAGVFIDYFSHRKPQLNIYLKNYSLKADNTSHSLLERNYNEFYMECRNRQKP